MDQGSLSKAELEATLKRLRLGAEDLEETLGFHYANSGAHIPAGELKRDQESLERLKNQIAEIEEILATPDG